MKTLKQIGELAWLFGICALGFSVLVLSTSVLMQVLKPYILGGAQ